LTSARSPVPSHLSLEGDPSCLRYVSS
jgi:hypothetical protein